MELTSLVAQLSLLAFLIILSTYSLPVSSALSLFIFILLFCFTFSVHTVHPFAPKDFLCKNTLYIIFLLEGIYRKRYGQCGHFLTSQSSEKLLGLIETYLNLSFCLVFLGKTTLIPLKARCLFTSVGRQSSTLSPK